MNRRVELWYDKEITISLAAPGTIRIDVGFIYLGFYVAFNTVQVISRRVVGRAEETSTCSSLGFCTVNCRPMASNYQLSHLKPCREPNPGLRSGRQECYHSATVAPNCCRKKDMEQNTEENMCEETCRQVWLS